MDVKMYNFSLPMPLSFKLIDDIEKINKELTKSKITAFYNCLPGNSPDLSGFEICRDFSSSAMTFNEFSKYIRYAQDKGFQFVYLLNLFKNYNSDDIDVTLDNTCRLIDKLLNTGCRNIRVTSQELIQFIEKKYPEINICTSTTQEYYNTNQYLNMLKVNNNIKEVIPSWNQNKNFKFLKNLNFLTKDKKIELMLNEGCRYGCHMRMGHSIQSCQKEPYKNKKYELFDYRKTCFNLNYENFWLYLCMSRVIYPWDLIEYNKIGINNFKFVGRNSPQFINGVYIKIYKTWLLCLEYPQLCDNLHLRLFNHCLIGNSRIKYKVKDIKPFLPDIKHFVKKGHLCDSSCGTECTYCYKKAQELKKVFGKS